MPLMSPHHFPAVAVTLWMVLVPANAQLAGIYEPFTHQANAGSWVVYDYADDELYVPAWDFAGDGQNPDIFFTFAGANALDFYADDLSSGGAFVGDLAAAGVDAIGCDIFVEDAASFDVAEFFLYSATDGRYYVSNYFTRESNGWGFAYVSLSGESWYVFQDGEYIAADLTPEILGEITEIGVTFHPLDVPGADGKVVALDNFTFYGAYVLPEITTSTAGGMFQLSFERRAGIAYSIRSAPDLAAWTTVPGEEFITGTSSYTMTRPLAPGSRFFKVGIEDFLTPVPDVSIP